MNSIMGTVCDAKRFCFFSILCKHITQNTSSSYRMIGRLQQLNAGSFAHFERGPQGRCMFEGRRLPLRRHDAGRVVRGGHQAGQGAQQRGRHQEPAAPADACARGRHVGLLQHLPREGREHGRQAGRRGGGEQDSGRRRREEKPRQKRPNRCACRPRPRRSRPCCSSRCASRWWCSRAPRPSRPS